MLLGSVLIYLAIAVNLFESDKTAYIYDVNASLVQALATETETKISSVFQSMEIVGSVANRVVSNAKRSEEHLKIVRDVFDANPEILELEIFSLSENRVHRLPGLRFRHIEPLEKFGLDEAFFKQIEVSSPYPLKKTIHEGKAVENMKLMHGPAMIVLGLRPAKFPNILVFARIQLTKIAEIFSNTGPYAAYLASESGKILFLPPAKGQKSDLYGAEEALQMVLATPSMLGSREFTGQHDRAFIVSHARIPEYSLVVVSAISLEKALLASQRLVRKSVLFAVVIIIFSMVMSAVFTKKMTSSIKKLFRATSKVAEGDFTVNVKPESKDEIGSLAQSFNHMTGEITRLMDQVADKARMEKELETARTVQENLFPAPHLKLDGFEISSFYVPAAECGGDWFGHLAIGKKVIVLVGDATGHGVPSALVTAAAQSCYSTMMMVGTKDGQLTIGPKDLMGYLNNSIFYAAKGKVKMTFFVSVLDTETGKVTYSNASHELPIVFRQDEGNVVQQILLDGDPDPCLGDDLGAGFREYSFQLEKGDLITWYTDGLLECKNEQDEEWGEFKFLRSVKRSLHENPTEIQEQVIGAAFDFSTKSGRDDDITFLVGRYAS